MALLPARWCAVAGLVAIGALLFAHAGVLNNVFQYDDVHSVVQNPHLRSVADPTVFFSDPLTFSARPDRAMFRPLVVLSYALTYSVAGLAPWAHLLVNLLAHAVNAGCVFALALALGVPTVAAGAASLLFALHPANSEVVNYVSSRSESFAAAGVLAALWAYLRWRNGAGGALLFFGVVAFSLALLSKATAITLPVMLLAVEACASHRRRVGAILPFAVVAIAYVWFVAGFASRALGDPVRPLDHQLWTQLKAILYYAHLLLMPAGLSVEHDFTVAVTLADPAVLLSTALLLSAALLWWPHARSRFGLLGAWTVLALVPASVIPLNVLVNEHRLYVASACLAIAVVGAVRPDLGIRRHGGNGRAVAAAGLFLLAILAVLSQQRSRVWDSEHALWSDAVRRAPHAYRAHMHLGGALEAEGEIAASLDSYRRAAMLAPHLAETHYNVGNALRLLGRPAPAREAWERSLQQNPDFLDALLNLAAHYQDAGDWEQTWLLLDRAEAVQPRSAEVWRRKGLARKLNGDMAGAERDYRRALKLDQTMAEAHYNLANLSYEAGRIDSAGRHYTRALRHNAAHHGAATNLALMLMNAGDAAAAVRICRDALRHTPDQSKLFYLLASALDAQGQTSEALVNFRIFLRFRDARGSVLLAVQRRIEQLEAIHK